VAAAGHFTVKQALHQYLFRQRLAWVATRAVEGASMGLIVGAAASLGVVGLLWWSGEPSTAFVIALSLLGMTCAGALTLLKIPSNLAVASRIDQQFRLHDLLSTALQTMGDRGADPQWRTILAAQAEAATAQLPGFGIRGTRFGPRLHAAAVLAVGMVVTVSAIASPNAGKHPRNSSRLDETNTASAKHAPDPASKQRTNGDSIRNTEDARIPTAPGPEATVAATLDRDGETNASDRFAFAEADSGDAAGASAGAGARNRSRETESTFLKPSPADASASGNINGVTAGGAAATELPAGEPRDASDTDAVGEVSKKSPQPVVTKLKEPPSSSDGQAQPRSPEIPPEHRELVRRFFSRD